MGTTTKALKLLNLFSNKRPEIGLSELARLAGRDKATTHRYLAELCDLGFVEQAQQNKLYRIGPAVLRLANIREQTFPMKTAAAQHISALVKAVQETAHISALQGLSLISIHSQLSLHHTTRVFIDDSEVLPLHATASGFAIMAFGPSTLLNSILDNPLPQKTPNTVIHPVEIQQKVDFAKSQGFAYSAGELEEGVSSVAAPLFGENDTCLAAISVVCPTGRLNKALDLKLRQNLVIASQAISSSWGGTVPKALLAIWNSQLKTEQF